MKKKITVLTLCVLLYALCSSAEAQQAKKLSRLGYPALRASASSQDEVFTNQSLV